MRKKKKNASYFTYLEHFFPSGAIYAVLGAHSYMSMALYCLLHPPGTAFS